MERAKGSPQALRRPEGDSFFMENGSGSAQRAWGWIAGSGEAPNRTGRLFGKALCRTGSVAGSAGAPSYESGENSSLGRASRPVARPLPKDRGASGCGLAGVFRGPMLRSNADRNAPCRPKKPPRLNYLTSKNPRLIILTGLSGGAARSRYCARDGPDFPIATVASPISSIRKTL